MNDSHKSEYIKGGIIGISQTILGHPLDTLKIWKQNRQSITGNIKLMDRKGINTLFRGMSYPLLLSTGYNSFLFGFYTTLRKKELSSFEAGFISGSFLGIVLNPFEYYKIQRQIGNQCTLFQKPLCGLQYTAMRESVACGLYFTTYEYFTEKIKLGSFISGGISGCISWFVTYPLDTVKTRYQSNSNKNGIYYFMQGGLFKGLGFCLIRAFLVNGVSFTLYEFMK